LRRRFYQKATSGDVVSMIFYLKAHRVQYRDRLAVDIAAVDAEIEERMRQLGINDPQTAFATRSTELKLLEAPKANGESISDDLAQAAITPEEEKRGT
jgi:hypothetical protein